MFRRPAKSLRYEFRFRAGIVAVAKLGPQDRRRPQLRLLASGDVAARNLKMWRRGRLGKPWHQDGL